MGCSLPTCEECKTKCSSMHGKDCVECPQNCLLIHGKNYDESSIVTSFFKIMMGDTFSDYMILPPKFERIALYFENQNKEQLQQLLEDSSGKQWIVTLSKCNGLWVLKEGWHAFSVDHRLEVGDFVMFHYIRGHHFVVQVFGRHGFEKHIYDKLRGRGKKRARSNSNLVAEKIEKSSTPSDSRKKQGSGNSAQSGSNIEPIRSEQVAADKISDTTGGNSNFEKHKHDKLLGRGQKRVRSNSNFVAENIEKSSTPSDSRKNQGSGNSLQSGSNIEPIRSEQVAAEKSSVQSGSNIKPIRSEQVAADKISAQLGSHIKPIRSEQVAADKISDTTGGVGKKAQVQETLCEDELVYMMNRDQGYEYEDRPTTLYDLSNFETLRSKDADGGDRVSENKGSPCIGTVGPRSEVMTEDVPKLVEAECFAASTSSGHPTSDSSDSQQKTDKKLSNGDRTSESVKGNTTMTHGGASAQQKFTHVPKPGVLNSKEPTKTQKCGFYGKVNMVKQEKVESEGEAFRPEKRMKGCEAVVNHIPLLKPVKPEPVSTEEEDTEEDSEEDSEDEELTVIPAYILKHPDWSLKVYIDSLSYLKSPVRFPCTVTRGRPPRILTKLVILCDPKDRPWPIMYREQCGHRLLMSGWKGFCKANGIKVGDACSFRISIEDGEKVIYVVTITRK